MKKFVKSYKTIPYKSNVFDMYFGSLKPCIFDIETTGLEMHSMKVIMAALLIPDGNTLTVTQFLAEKPSEEDEVLEASINFLKSNSIDYLVTYNGASFDIPAVNTRLEKLHLKLHLDYYNLDLYKMLKNYSDLKNQLSSLSQKSVETYMGIGDSRKDTITGKESVTLYNQYALLGDGTSEKIILTHNREDVTQLYKLMKTLAFTDLHKALYHYGFTQRYDKKISIVPRLKNKTLEITGKQYNSAINASVFSDITNPISAEFRSETADYTVSVPISIYKGSKYIDLHSITANMPVRETLLLKKLDGYINNNLILSTDGIKKYRELNTLSVLIMDKLFISLLPTLF